MIPNTSWYLTEYECGRGQPEMMTGLTVAGHCKHGDFGLNMTLPDILSDTSKVFIVGYEPFDRLDHYKSMQTRMDTWCLFVYQDLRQA